MTTREIEDDLIKESLDRTKKSQLGYVYLSGKDYQKKLRSQADTIPLTAFTNRKGFSYSKNKRS